MRREPFRSARIRVHTRDCPGGRDGTVDPVHDADQVGQVGVVEGRGEGMPQELAAAIPGPPGQCLTVEGDLRALYGSRISRIGPSE